MRGAADSLPSHSKTSGVNPCSLGWYFNADFGNWKGSVLSLVFKVLQNLWERFYSSLRNVPAFFSVDVFSHPFSLRDVKWLRTKEWLCTKSLCFFLSSCLEMTGFIWLKVHVGAHKTLNLLIASQIKITFESFSVVHGGLSLPLEVLEKRCPW